jgi:predicted dienelactone hydrolase
MKPRNLWLVFLCIAPLHALTATDLSAPGPLTVETLEFRDATGGPSEPEGKLARTRSRLLLRRFRREAPPEGRTLHIKLHLPGGLGPFPIVVVSHGAGGDWDTHFAQAQHLASHGYAVLCLEHVGSNRDRMTQGFRLMKSLDAMIHDSQEVLGRPKDVSAAIQCAQAWNQSHAVLGGRLNTRRVGVMGHSFGAFTTMAVCGMRPALDWITPLVEPGKGLGPDLSDPNVRCGIALSPQGFGEPFFHRESFQFLKVPLLGISGTLDKQQNGLPAENRRDAFALWPAGAHRFVWLTNARHLDFTDATGAAQTGLPSPTRTHVQPLVRAATLLFFNEHLRNSAGAAGQITKPGLSPYLQGSVSRVEVLSK